MKKTLKVYGKAIDNPFSLLGSKENDITLATAYVLANSPAFFDAFVRKLDISPMCNGDIQIDYQLTNEKGRTDIEIRMGNSAHIIIEAKRGIVFPNTEQMNKYVEASKHIDAKERRLVILNNLSRETPEMKPINTYGIPETLITYKSLMDMAEMPVQPTNRKERQMLMEYARYLSKEVVMDREHSNTVYVVSLSEKSINEHDVLRQYRCPVGKNYLTEAPNYIGFRFKGKLQYINHVESTEVIHDKDGDLFVFSLGPDIEPKKEVKSGKMYNGTKLYCDIDLLLTCDTILEAGRKTRERHQGERHKE